MATKQVIVVRKDLKMRKGKIGAQCAHASMKVFFDIMQRTSWIDFVGNHGVDYVLRDVKKEMDEWIQGSFTKVVVYVNNEEELLETYEKAKEANLPCSLIKDNGLTEFHGEKTYTCVGIGPDEVEKIDVITGHLPLY